MEQAKQIFAGAQPIDQGKPSPGEPLICPLCASVVVLDEFGTIREPTIAEMLQWNQKTHDLVERAQTVVMEKRKI